MLPKTFGKLLGSKKQVQYIDFRELVIRNTESPLQEWGTFAAREALSKRLRMKSSWKKR
jgi:hypothetical protein